MLLSTRKSKRDSDVDKIWARIDPVMHRNIEKALVNKKVGM